MDDDDDDDDDDPEDIEPPAVPDRNFFILSISVHVFACLFLFFLFFCFFKNIYQPIAAPSALPSDPAQSTQNLYPANDRALPNSMRP